MTRIGVGVIGCGDIARIRYFPSMEALPDFQLAGVFSRDLSECEAAVGRYGGRVYGDLETLLRDSSVDAVIVATPHPSHAELTVRALDAGKHVLTEKPMATSLTDAARIREAAHRSRGIFMALPFEGSPLMKEAKRLVESGAIGKVSSADAVLAHRGPVHAPWFFDREQAGWGVLADLGIYLVSQLTYLFGPAESIVGRVATAIPDRTSLAGPVLTATVEDNAAALLTWPGNLLTSIRANWCSAGDHRNFIWQATIYGTKGVLFINMAAAEDNIVIYSPAGPIQGAEKIAYNGMTECYRPALPAWDRHADILRAFADAIRRGKSADNEAETARQHHVIEIIAKLYESSQRGAVQHLATRF